MKPSCWHALSQPSFLNCPLPVIPADPRNSRGCSRAEVPSLVSHARTLDRNMFFSWLFKQALAFICLGSNLTSSPPKRKKGVAGAKLCRWMWHATSIPSSQMPGQGGYSRRVRWILFVRACVIYWLCHRKGEKVFPRNRPPRLFLAHLSPPSLPTFTPSETMLLVYLSYAKCGIPNTAAISRGRSPTQRLYDTWT